MHAFIDYLQNVMAPSGFTEFTAQLRHRRTTQQPFPTPLLLIYSRQDPVVPATAGNHLAKLIPDAQLRWIDQTSHFAHVDTPTDVTNLILDFLHTR